ncbi:MAG: hypothetical protein WA323_03260 [Candidatus Nitrosopolaris sp.]
MKQIIFSIVAALLLSGFFVEQAFALQGTNGGKAGDGTKGGVGVNGGNGISGKTLNGKNGTNANGHGGSPDGGE